MSDLVLGVFLRGAPAEVGDVVVGSVAVVVAALEAVWAWVGPGREDEGVGPGCAALAVFEEGEVEVAAGVCGDGSFGEVAFVGAPDAAVFGGAVAREAWDGSDVRGLDLLG